MKVFTSKNNIEKALQRARETGKTIGLVPTMGMLHAGHISLVEKSVSENDITVCSIFVNPAQFNNREDFVKYPKNIDADLELLNGANCDIVFLPEEKEMYPEGESREKIDLGYVTKPMEGKFRPGHFEGVAQIVSRLTELVKPHHSYYGEKDYQQLLVVKKLFKCKGFDGKVVGCAIKREKCGLAMSSRNERLSEVDKQRACFIYECLREARKMVFHSEPRKVERVMKDRFKSRPEFDLEYFTIADERTLQPFEGDALEHARIFTAAHLSGVRLIDNLKV